MKIGLPLLTRAGIRIGMANAVGPCEDGLGAGGSAGWNHAGERLAQLSPKKEALLWLHTQTLKAE